MPNRSLFQHSLGSEVRRLLKHCDMNIKNESAESSILQLDRKEVITMTLKRVLPEFKGYTIDFRRGRFVTNGQVLSFATREGFALLDEAKRQAPIFVEPLRDYDALAWNCPCGQRIVDRGFMSPNEVAEGGFYPSNWSGKEVERTPWDWPIPLYTCGRCGRIMHADWLAVVSLSEEDLLATNAPKQRTA